MGCPSHDDSATSYWHTRQGIVIDNWFVEIKAKSRK